jgi:hypothetical protein
MQEIIKCGFCNKNKYSDIFIDLNDNYDKAIEGLENGIISFGEDTILIVEKIKQAKQEKKPIYRCYDCEMKMKGMDKIRSGG